MRFHDSSAFYIRATALHLSSDRLAICGGAPRAFADLLLLLRRLLSPRLLYPPMSLLLLDSLPANACTICRITHSTATQPTGCAGRSTSSCAFALTFPTTTTKHPRPPPLATTISSSRRAAFASSRFRVFALPPAILIPFRPGSTYLNSTKQRRGICHFRWAKQVGR